MIYLREFVLPKDEWIDCCFGSKFPPEDLPRNMPILHQSTAVSMEHFVRKRIETF